MSVLVDIDEYNDPGIKICPNGTEGEVVELGGLVIVLPAVPSKKKIYGHGKSNRMQMWERAPMPDELSRIRSMDEWAEMPREFRQKFSPYIEEEFRRRREGFWFFNNGVREPVDKTRLE